MLHRIMKLIAMATIAASAPKIDALTITDSSRCRTLPAYIRDTCLADLATASRFDYKRMSSKHECGTLDDSTLIQACNEAQAAGRFYFAASRHLPASKAEAANESRSTDGPSTQVPAAAPEERMAAALEKMAFYAKFNFIVTAIGLSLAAAGIVVTIVQ